MKEITIRYKIQGYNSVWVRKAKSLESFVESLTGATGAFKTCTGKPEFSWLEVVEKDGKNVSYIYIP